MPVNWKAKSSCVNISAASEIQQCEARPQNRTVYSAHQESETPLPVYIGVMLHVKTRKRDLIDRLHVLGISISYDHVLRLSSDMANAVCEHFKETHSMSSKPKNERLHYSSSR